MVEEKNKKSYIKNNKSQKQAMLTILKETGYRITSQRKLYKLSCGGKCNNNKNCIVLLENKQEIVLTGHEWKDVISAGLRAKGYIEDESVETVTLSDKVCISNVCF